MASLTFTRSDLFLAPAVKVAGQTRGLGNADMLALNGLSMATHAIQSLSIRMFAQMFIMAELNLVIKHDKIFVFIYPFMTVYLLTGCTADITVRLSAV